MRNLSPLGAIHSPIDADRDVTAYSTDFDKLGLPDRSPFAILSRPRAQINTGTAPKKRGPKARTQRERIIASLQDLPIARNFNTDIPTREESDRTLAIRGGATC